MTVPHHLWRVPPSDLTLSAKDVHVWQISLQQPAEWIDRLAQMLSPDERVKAKRFYFERDQRRFIVGRGALRTILGRYLGVGPDRIQFRYGPRGKPYLSEEWASFKVEFNLAHSNELALYAFTRGREVGIDIEYIHPLPDAEQIAARFFSKPENDVLLALPRSQQLEAFFNCWTRKEAYIKAIGDGLARPLDSFQVSLAPGEPAQLKRVEGMSEETARWSFVALTPSPGYIGALAVEGSDWQLTCWQCVL